jgi:hypothetical protein
MYHLDNGSGIDVMPVLKQVASREQKWFTEGDTKTPPSYPGQDWFNIIQAEILNVLNEANIQPEKTKLNQLTAAIKCIINNNTKEFLPLSGGQLAGDLTIEKTNASIILSTNDTNYTLSTSATGDVFSFYFPDADNNNTQRLIYTKQDKTFNFKACEVKINNNDVVTSDRFESSLSERGYQKLPGGLIIQWGYQKSSFSNRQQKVTFPVTFPRAAFCVVCNNFGPIDLYDDTADVGCYSKTTTSFQAYNYSDKNPAGFCWIAFGN